MFQLGLPNLLARLPNWINAGNLPYNLLNNTQAKFLFVDQLRNRLSDRSLIFVVSSGRAGSGFLSRLLDSAANARSFHEPLPKMNGTMLQLASDFDMAITKDRRQCKILGINLSLLRLPNDIVYIETNHLFIKSFFDIIMDYYRNVRVIILQRDLRLVLKSFVELGYMTDRNPRSRMWMQDANATNNLTRAIRPVEHLDTYERCIAYLLEIEARAQWFERTYPKVVVGRVNLADITQPEGARALFQKIGLIWTKSSADAVRNVTNPRKERKAFIGQQTSIFYCEERIQQYIEMAKAMNISLPEINCIG